jgi:hypothetical protein
MDPVASYPDATKNQLVLADKILKASPAVSPKGINEPVSI